MRRGNAIIDLNFPIGGLNRRYSYQHQPPYTTPNCLNIRPDESLEGRARGGSRPGLGKAFSTQLGSGSPIRLLAEMETLNNTGYSEWYDYFFGDEIQSCWSTATWLTNGIELLPSDETNYQYRDEVGSVLDSLDINTSSDYSIGIYITPHKDEHWGTYRIYARMDDTTPALLTDGIIAGITLTGKTGAFTGSLSEYHAGVETNYIFTTDSVDTVASAGWFEITITTSTNTIKCYWKGRLLLTQAITAHAGKRIGFGMACTVAGGVCLTDIFSVKYYKTTVIYTQKQLFLASAGGKFYKSTEVGQPDMTEITSTSVLQSDRSLQCVSRGNMLYIADWDENGTTKPKSFNLSTGILADLAGTNELVSVPTVGTIPLNCSIVFLYRDRLCWAGDYLYPHIWYQSRQGVPTDYDYGVSGEDVQRAVYGSTAEAGKIGQPIKAAIPFNDDYVIYGCISSLWILRGDAAYGGQLDCLSHDIGIVDRNAWAKGPGGELIFLTHDGVYYLLGPDSLPRSLSREKLPRELLNVDPNLYEISMEYDTAARGIHLYLTPYLANSKQLHWWINWSMETNDTGQISLQGSFWPVQLQSDHQPTCLFRHDNDSKTRSGVMLGGSDGYIRQYRHTLDKDDDLYPITSHIVYGPILLGRNGYSEGSLEELIGILAKSSGDTRWEVFFGESPEDCMSQDRILWGEWTQGLNIKVHPRRRGQSCLIKIVGGESLLQLESEGFIKLEDNSGLIALEQIPFKGLFGIESITIVVKPLGKQRVK